MREKPEVTHPSEKKFDAENPEAGVALPNPDLNPMVNQTLGRNLGRWAQVYFTNAPENRDKAVGDLLRELEHEGVVTRKGPKSEKSVRQAERTADPRQGEVAAAQRQVADRDGVPADSAHGVIACPHCRYENSAAQGFCGMCGGALSGPQEARSSSARPAAPADNMDWLRQQPLASFRVSEKDTDEDHNAGGRVVAVVVAVLIAVFSGYTWWSRTHNDAPAGVTQSAAASSPASGAETSQAIPQRAPVAENLVKKTAPQQLGAGEDRHIAAMPTVAAPAGAAPVAATPKRAPGAGFAASEKDASKSVSAISSADGDAELAMAQKYLYGVNGPKDTSEAARWLWKAVGKQNRTALLLLADLYQHGDGVAKSCDQAQLLLVAAAKKGLPEAGERLRYLQSVGCN